MALVPLAHRLPFVRNIVQLPIVRWNIKDLGTLPLVCSAKGLTALLSVKPTKPVPREKPVFKPSVVVSPVFLLVTPLHTVTLEKVALGVADATSNLCALEWLISPLHLKPPTLIPSSLKATLKAILTILTILLILTILTILPILPLTALILFFTLHHLPTIIRIRTHPYRIWALRP